MKQYLRDEIGVSEEVQLDENIEFDGPVFEGLELQHWQDRLDETDIDILQNAVHYPNTT